MQSILRNSTILPVKARNALFCAICNGASDALKPGSRSPCVLIITVKSNSVCISRYRIPNIRDGVNWGHTSLGWTGCSYLLQISPASCIRVTMPNVVVLCHRVGINRGNSQNWGSLRLRPRAGFTLVEALCGVVVEPPLCPFPSLPLPSLPSPPLPFLSTLA